MDVLDAAMMTGEVLSSPMHVAALMIFTPPADAGPHFVDDLFRAALRSGADMDPRLTRRPHLGADSLGRWTWRTVEVDPADHMQLRILPEGADEHALWELIGELHGVPLDRDKPQWAGYLIDGLPDGRFACYVKIHHTLVDGVAGMQMVMDRLSTDPTQRSMSPFFAGQHAGARDSGESGRSWSLPSPVAAVQAVLDTTRSSIGMTRDLISGAAGYLAGGLQQQAPLPLSAPFTRFNGTLGPRRAVAGGSWPLQRFLAIREAAGVRLGDVLTAVVSGALRSWLVAHDELPDRSLVAFCPISVRGRGDSEDEANHGNLFGLELCPLATDVEEPAERLAAVHRSMTWAMEQVEQHGSTVTALLAAPIILPSFLMSVLPLLPKWRTGYNMPVSHLRGPVQHRYFNGAHLDSVYPVSTVFDGLGLNITTYSYAGQVAFGYVAGREMVPDISTLIPLTEAALVELETAVGV